MPYSTRLIQKEEVAAGTMKFSFAKPDGFTFKAGQSIDLTLINPPETDAEGNTRAFSLVASPEESELAITTRMRDTAFKRVLKDMPENSEMTFDGPFGSMTLHNDTSKPAVLLAGGIGITPFYSMIKSATAQKLPHKLFLFYSNRRPEDTAFLHELEALAKENPNFTFIGTMTEMEKSAQEWSGERGYITKKMILKYAPDLLNSIAYMAGPPGMVAAMRKTLNDAGLNDDYIRSEEFSGY